MAKLDISSYRSLVLGPVEDCMISSRESGDGYSSYSFYQALRSELTRADMETGLIELPADFCEAVDQAAGRIIDHMHTHRDLGFGASS
jgi:hypothetical protein